MALFKKFIIPPVAKVANFANNSLVGVRDSQDSRDSQGVQLEKILLPPLPGDVIHTLEYHKDRNVYIRRGICGKTGNRFFEVIPV